MNSATNCSPLPATKYALGANLNKTECPATPAQAYRLGHGEKAFWLSRKCETN